MGILDFVQDLFGKKVTKYISILALGVTLAWAVPTYIVTPSVLQQEIQKMQDKQEKKDTGFQIQLNEATMRTLSNEIFQLKKLKLKGLADELDKESLEDLKKEYDKIKVETDSLKKSLYKTTK